MKIKKAIVTGGAGFIGSNLVDKLVDMGVEVHVIDEKVFLYGKDVEVEFVSFLRSEIKFKSAELLRSKIREDIERVKKERVITSG